MSIFLLTLISTLFFIKKKEHTLKSPLTIYPVTFSIGLIGAQLLYKDFDLSLGAGVYLSIVFLLSFIPLIAAPSDIYFAKWALSKKKVLQVFFLSVAFFTLELFVHHGNLSYAMFYGAEVVRLDLARGFATSDSSSIFAWIASIISVFSIFLIYLLAIAEMSDKSNNYIKLYNAAIVLSVLTFLLPYFAYAGRSGLVLLLFYGSILYLYRAKTKKLSYRFKLLILIIMILFLILFLSITLSRHHDMHLILDYLFMPYKNFNNFWNFKDGQVYLYFNYYFFGILGFLKAIFQFDSFLGYNIDSPGVIATQMEYEFFNPMGLSYGVFATFARDAILSFGVNGSIIFLMIFSFLLTTLLRSQYIPLVVRGMLFCFLLWHLCGGYFFLPNVTPVFQLSAVLAFLIMFFYFKRKGLGS